jgi:hypothetical protein
MKYFIALLASMAMAHGAFAAEAKKEEPKKEAPKAEAKKEEPKKEEKKDGDKPKVKPVGKDGKPVDDAKKAAEPAKK